MIVFDRDLCVGCGECIKDCVSYCITMEDGKACLKADSTQCIRCGHCIAVCPVNAVGIEDAEYETAAVEEIREALPKVDTAALSQDLGALFSGYLVGVINRSEELKAWLGISGCTVKTCVLMGYPAVHYKRSAPRKFTKVSWL